jgi:thiamine pyrophosphate-dependent acetolactate synthase large subunit-like protein
MDREMIDKNVAILELIADFKIAVTQLNEDCKNARTRADIAENAIDNLRTEKRCADIKMDRVLNRLKNMLEDDVIAKEDIQDCIEILEND